MSTEENERLLTHHDLIIKNKEEEAQKAKDRVNELVHQLIDPHYACKFKPEFIKELLMHVGVKGMSYQSLAFQLGTTAKTLYNWEAKFPIWKSAKQLAQTGRVGFIEKLLTDLADGTVKGNAAAAIFYAKNACPDQFKDKRELEVKGGVTYVIDTGIPAKQLPPELKAIEAEIIEEAEIVETDDDLEDLL